jgi:hypothetical protein
MKQVNVTKLDSQKVKAAQAKGGTYDGTYGSSRTATEDKSVDNVKDLTAAPDKDIPENSPNDEPEAPEAVVKPDKRAVEKKATSVEEPNEGTPKEEKEECDKMEQGTTGTYDGEYGKKATSVEEPNEKVAKSEEDEEDEDKDKEEAPDVVKKEGADQMEDETPAKKAKRMACAPLPKVEDVSIFGRQVKTALGSNKTAHTSLNEAFMNNWQALAADLFKK